MNNLIFELDYRKIPDDDNNYEKCIQNLVKHL